MIARTSDIVDGVHRYPSNGIKVIIVGGGVGGLGAALECWRKGCEVVVFEQAEKISPLGDFFTITPPALSTLKDYPSMHKDYHECVYDCSIHVYSPSGKAIKSTMPEWKQEGITHSAPDVDVSFLKRRPVFAKMQYDQLQRLGVPVHFSQKVISAEETDASVTVKLADGTEHVADVCIVADGIGGKIEGLGTEAGISIQDSGYACARIAFSRSVIPEDSLAATLLTNVNTRPEFRTYVADDLHLILFLTHDWVAWVFTHKDDNTAKESWGNLTSLEELAPYLSKSSAHWDPTVLNFIHRTPGKIINWKLRWRDGSDKWTSEKGRLLRLGDAAHAFFPTAGNGANQALEDGISIAECLRIAGKDGVTDATKVHTKLRFERVSILQQTGFLNREELHTVDIAAMENSPEEVKVGFFKQGRWAWDHRPELYVADSYKACLAHVKYGKKFLNSNVPPGHVYKPWTLETEMKRMAAGIPSGLKENGYWGF